MWNKQSIILWIGIISVSLLLCISIFAPLLPFVQPDLEKQLYIKLEDGSMLVPPLPASEDYPIGTDRVGRDLLSVLVMGTKETLLIVLTVAVLRFLLGVPLGFLASQKKHFKSLLGFWNQLFSYIPSFFLVMILAFLPYIVFSPKRFWWMIGIMVVVEVGKIAMTSCNTFEQIKEKEYVQAGIVVGTSPLFLFLRYYLKPTRAALLVQFVFDISRSMLLLAQLGFVGIFITHVAKQQEDGSFYFYNTSLNWPVSLEKITLSMFDALWIPLWSTTFMVIAIISFNLLGEGLKHYFHSKEHRA